MDKRADVWVFGVVLFEMLAGRRLFEGETVSDVLTGVLRSDPDWSALPAATPAVVRRLLRRCLAGDPRSRLRGGRGRGGSRGAARVAAYSSQPDEESAPDIFVVSASGGPAKRLTTDPAAEERPFWSKDGRSVYFARAGAGIWSVASTGGAETHITRVTGSMAALSPDGGWVYALRADRIERFPLVPDPTPEAAPQVVGRDPTIRGAMAVTTRGVYYLSPAADGQSADLRLLPLDGGEPRTPGTIPHVVGRGLSVSPDFRSIVYSQCDQCTADLMLVEGFH